MKHQCSLAKQCPSAWWGWRATTSLGWCEKWLCDHAIHDSHTWHVTSAWHLSIDPSLRPGLKFKISQMSNWVNFHPLILRPSSHILQQVGNDSPVIPNRSSPDHPPPHTHTHFIYKSLVSSMMVPSSQKTTVGWLLPQSLYECTNFFLPLNT